MKRPSKIPQKHPPTADGEQPEDTAAAALTRAHARDEQRSFALRLGGAAAAFRFSSKLSDFHYLVALRQVHASKAYESLDMSWEDYCEHVIGVDRRSVYEQLRSLDLLGDDVMESIAPLNLSRSAYRVLRSLPEDARPKLLESGELEIGDQRVRIDAAHRDDVIDMIEEICARNARMREQLDTGAEQLATAESKVTELTKTVRELKKPRGPAAEGLTEFDTYCSSVWTGMREVLRRINDEEPGTERERALKWIHAMHDTWKELVAYAGNWTPQSAADVFGPDAAGVAELEKDLRERERRGED